MKKGGNWGKCPKRYVGWAQKDGVIGSYCYICGKNGDVCDPDYCLGPDEEGNLTEKETENEG